MMALVIGSLSASVILLSLRLVGVNTELRKLRAAWAEQAQIVAVIATNAEDGGRFMVEHRARIERLENILVRPPSTRRVEGRN